MSKEKAEELKKSPDTASEYLKKNVEFYLFWKMFGEQTPENSRGKFSLSAKAYQDLNSNTDKIQKSADNIFEKKYLKKEDGNIFTNSFYFFYRLFNRKGFFPNSLNFINTGFSTYANLYSKLLLIAALLSVVFFPANIILPISLGIVTIISQLVYTGYYNIYKSYQKEKEEKVKRYNDRIGMEESLIKDQQEKTQKNNVEKSIGDLIELVSQNPEIYLTHQVYFTVEMIEELKKIDKDISDKNNEKIKEGLSEISQNVIKLLIKGPSSKDTPKILSKFQEDPKNLKNQFGKETKDLSINSTLQSDLKDKIKKITEQMKIRKTEIEKEKETKKAEEIRIKTRIQVEEKAKTVNGATTPTTPTNTQNNGNGLTTS